MNIKSIGIRNARIGQNVTIIEPVNIYDCTIGENSFIGPFTEIQKNVMIGHNCKIQSHSFVCELVTIGDNCFVSHGVMFINDTFSSGGPAGGDKSKWKRTHVENNVSIGTNSTILPVIVTDNAVIGSGFVVTKDIVESGIMPGIPQKD